MDERAFKTKITQELKKRGYFVFATHDTYRAGVPDLYVCKKGLSIWIELKYSESSTLAHALTAPQSKFLRDINRAGGLGIALVGRADNMACCERITEVGERSKFENEKPLEEVLEWISNFATDFATQSTESNTHSSENIEDLFDFL